MKAKFLMMALGVAAVLGFSSCSNDEVDENYSSTVTKTENLTRGAVLTEEWTAGADVTADVVVSNNVVVYSETSDAAGTQKVEGANEYSFDLVNGVDGVATSAKLVGKVYENGEDKVYVWEKLTWTTTSSQHDGGNLN